MKHLKYFWCLFLTLSTLSFAACSDDEDEEAASAPMAITQVYLENTSDTINSDRPVEFARLGQTVRLEGSGFRGLKQIYVNGYKTYFSTTFVTDNNIIFALDANTPVSEADDSVRNTIRLVKDGTELVYRFTIRAASPSITGISCTLPAEGEEVTVYGSNLQETSKVTLPGGVVVDAANIANAPETEEESGTWFSFRMPAGVKGSGSIIAECANGTAQSPKFFNNRDCMVLDFDGAGAQGSWGWSETGSMINGDDLVDDPLNSGRGKVLQLIPQRLLGSGIAAGKGRATECWTAGTGNELDDWSRMYDSIPETTPLTDVAFQFDIYVPDAWVGTGVIELVMINNYNFGGIGSDDDNSKAMTAFYCPWVENGKAVPFSTKGWQTVTIPFSEFKKYAALIKDGKTPTFKDVVDDRNAATYKNFGMGFVNKDFSLDGSDFASSVSRQLIYIDNWRVVPCSKISISDFPAE